MVLALGGEVESAQEQLTGACLAQGRTTSGKSVLNLHVQVLRRAKYSKTLPPSEWAGWLQWSGCSESCGLGRRGRTRVCSHSNSTEAISLVDPGSISGDSDQSSADELINEALDNLVVDSSGQENEESEDILSGNSSGDSPTPSPAESVGDPLERARNGMEDPWGSCAGEMSQMEDCQERKCPGLWV